MADEEKPIDLSDLQFQMMPDWVSESSTGGKAADGGLSDFIEREGEHRDRDRRSGPGRGGDRRGDRRGGGPGGGRGDRDRDRRGSGGGGGRPRDRDGGRDRRSGDRGRDRRSGDRDRRGREDRPEALPPKGLRVTVRPMLAGMGALAETIRKTGRTFALIDLARFVVKERNRTEVVFEPDPKAEGEAPRMFRCKPDGSLWLTRDEAVRHFIGSPLVERFYGIEDVAVDPPKGNFTGIGVCGMSGTLLGPPNHHSYQEALLRLHRERFSNMPLDRFKSRIRIETGEEIVEKWKAEQSKRTEFVYPKPPEPTPSESGGDADTEAPSDTSEATPPASEGAPEPSDEGTPAPEAAEAVPATAEPTVESEPAAESSAEGESPEPEEPSDGAESVEEPAEVEGESAEPEPKPAGERFVSLAELERHVRQHLADEIIEEAAKAVVSGGIPGRNLSPGLLAGVRWAGERVRRAPSMIIPALCDGLGEHGLKIFRWGDGKQLFTSGHRPHQLDPGAALSQRIRAIFDYVKAHPGTKPGELSKALAPGIPADQEEPPAATEATTDTVEPIAAVGTAAPSAEPAGAIEPATTEPVAAADVEAEPTPTPSPPETTPKSEGQADAAEKPKSKGKGRSSKAPAEAAPLSPDQIAVLKDLRWLVTEGYIVEFADGRLEAVRVRESGPAPARKKPKGPKARAASSAAAPESTEPVVEAAAPSQDQDAPDRGDSPDEAPASASLEVDAPAEPADAAPASEPGSAPAPQAEPDGGRANSPDAEGEPTPPPGPPPA